MENYLYTYTLMVTEEHIDELNHVNNVVYVQWIQDAAVNHWNSTAPISAKENFVWVIVRHEIDYKKAARLGEELLISTRILNARGVMSDRQVQIRRKQNNELLVEAKTTWCMLEAASLKPARITPEIITAFLPPDDKSNLA